MISICLKNSRGRFSSTLGPDVPPHTTRRPPGRSARTERSQVAGPDALDHHVDLTGQSASESKAAAAPSASARLALGRVAGGGVDDRAHAAGQRQGRGR